MVEYRPFPEDRKAEFHKMANYAFSPEDGQFDPEDVDERPSLERPRGLFEDDDPLVICAHRDFRLRIRGVDREVAGLSVVASAPEHRRQGYVKRLLAESLSEYRANGTAFSVLWPFEYSFYRKYGWATVSQYVYVTTPPDRHFLPTFIRNNAANQPCELTGCPRPVETGARCTVGAIVDTACKPESAKSRRREGWPVAGEPE